MDSSFVTNIRGCIESATDLMGGNLQLVYYSHIPVAIIAFLIGFFVIIKNRKDLSARVMFFLSMIFALWVICSLVSWISPSSVQVSFFWSLFGLLNSMLFISCLYLVYTFKNDEDMPLWLKVSLGLLLVPIIIMTPTSLNVGDFNYTYCYPVDNLFLGYMAYFEGIVTLIMIVVAVKRYIVTKSQKKHEIVLISLATALFLLSIFGTAYISDKYQRYDIEVYGVFAMPLFLGFLAYLIVKYKAFNIKLLATQALVWALVILIGSQFLFIQNNTNKVLTAITLVISGWLGLTIIRSVKKEIEAREMIEKQEKALEIANAKLKELDQLKSEFVSLATHQIRAPLSAIKGYLSEVFDGDFGPINNELEKPLRIVYQSTENLVNIVSDFLNISRIESGNMKYELAPVNLKQIVEETTNGLKPNFDRAGLELKMEIPEGNYNVYADVGKVKQVIGNLIDNSMKYTPKGSISISLKTNEKTQKVLFTIADTGIGIPAEVIPKLFQKFTRAKGANEVNIIGTGLGLYVAKLMIEGQKGRIWVESPGAGKGSTFFVELPIAHVS